MKAGAVWLQAEPEEVASEVELPLGSSREVAQGRASTCSKGARVERLIVRTAVVRKKKMWISMMMVRPSQILS